jgi:hypothetical protein
LDYKVPWQVKTVTKLSFQAALVLHRRMTAETPTRTVAAVQIKTVVVVGQQDRQGQQGQQVPAAQLVQQVPAAQLGLLAHKAHQVPVAVTAAAVAAAAEAALKAAQFVAWSMAKCSKFAVFLNAVMVKALPIMAVPISAAAMPIRAAMHPNRAKE